MPLKKKIKNYLLSNNINSLKQLTDHIEVLKASEDLSIDDRNILFNLVYCVCNKKDSLLSFFGENKISKDVFIDLDNLIKSSNKESIKEGFWNMDMTNTDVVFGKDTCITNFFTDWNYQENLSKEMAEALNNTVNRIGNDTPQYRCNSPKTNLSDKNFGKKETEGKLYYEISWEFIEEMAKRMANNKSEKYDLYNWKRPMTPKGIEDLKQAINRHHVEVMKGNYKDGEENLGHVVSYACNAMMLWYQLK